MFSRVFKRKQTDVDDLIDQAATFVTRGNFDLARQRIFKAIEMDPQNSKTLSNIATILVLLSHSADALEFCDRAIESDPKNAEAWRIKGLSLQGLNRRKEALACYDKALAADPTFYKALSTKAHCLSGLDLFKEAIECCDAAIKICPSDEKKAIQKNRKDYEFYLNRKNRGTS